MQRTSVSMLNLLLLYKSNHQHSGSADGGLHFIDVSFHKHTKTKQTSTALNPHQTDWASSRNVQLVFSS